MNWQPADTQPTEPGWYIVAEPHSDRPLVLWWSQLSTGWRHGARLTPVRAWCGPIATPALELPL